MSAHLGGVQNQCWHKGTKQCVAQQKQSRAALHKCIPSAHIKPQPQSSFPFKQRRHRHRRWHGTDKEGLKFRPKLLFPSARQLCTRNTACKHFFVKHSITSCFMNKMRQSQGNKRWKWGSNMKWHAAIRPPRPTGRGHSSARTRAAGVLGSAAGNRVWVLWIQTPCSVLRIICRDVSKE